MSLPNSPGFESSPDNVFAHQKGNKQKLRSVRLQLPSMDFGRFANQNTQPSSNKTGSFGSMPVTIPAMQGKQRPQLTTTTIGNVQVESPNVFYQFSPLTEPTFVYEVVIPDNAFPFVAQPCMDLVTPRFLLYTKSQTAISTQPVKLVLNGTKIEHWMADPSPIDATDLLVPFGQQNWLIVETRSLVVPFVIIGVWCSFFTFSDIVSSIRAREQFPFTEVGAVCPLTGRQIDVPAKGINCAHSACFDLFSYITIRQAIGNWFCPICNLPCSMDDLRIGELLQYPSFERQPQIPNPVWSVPTQENDQQWTVQDQEQTHTSFEEDDAAMFWNQD